MTMHVRFGGSATVDRNILNPSTDGHTLTQLERIQSYSEACDAFIRLDDQIKALPESVTLSYDGRQVGISLTTTLLDAYTTANGNKKPTLQAVSESDKWVFETMRREPHQAGFLQWLRKPASMESLDTLFQRAVNRAKVLAEQYKAR